MKNIFTLEDFMSLKWGKTMDLYISAVSFTIVKDSSTNSKKSSSRAGYITFISNPKYKITQ